MEATTRQVGPGRLLRLGNMFCLSRALHSAVELGVFTALHAGPATTEELRTELGLQERGTAEFLHLLSALGLLVRDGDRFANSAVADECLGAGGEDGVAGFLRGLATNIYPLWDGLGETLRTGAPRSTPGDFEEMLTDPEQRDRYVRMMDGLLQVVGPRVVAAVDWSGVRSVLDVGGCCGTLAGQIVCGHPGITAAVFDLPPMGAACERYVAERGLTGTVRFHGGDFFRDPLPTADVVVFGHVLHNWTWSQRARLVASAFDALPPGGALLVYDRMLDANRSNIDNLVASLTMALVTEDGAEYAADDLRRLVLDAGFATVDLRPLDDEETLAVCRKAGPRGGGPA